LLGDFFVTGDHTLGELAEIYGLDIAPKDAATTLADFIAERAKRSLRQGAVVPLGPIALVAHRMADGKVTSVGLRLAEPEPEPPAPATFAGRIRAMARRALAATGFSD
jgi:cell volume regulation protein A